MSKAYKSPGVYIEEITSPPLIEVADTAIPAFIGYTQKAQRLEVGDLLFVPTRISSMVDFEFLFGTPVHDLFTVSIDDTVDVTAAGTALSSREISAKPDFLKNCMHDQLQLYFANGGGPCYIVSTGKPKSVLNKRDLLKGLDEIYNHRETTLIIFPDAFALQKSADLFAIYSEALSQAAELKDRFVIMDLAYSSIAELSDAGFFGSPLVPTDMPAAATFGAAYFPMLSSSIPFYYADSTVKIQHQVLQREAGKADQNVRGEYDKLKLPGVQLQEPTVYAAIKDVLQQQTYLLSPGAAVAGVYVQVDSSRGVWKSPANVRLQLIKEPVLLLNEQEQSTLQAGGTQSRSVNAIRLFPGKGTVVWGARTLAGNHNEWRYVSVRRFFMMIETSVLRATERFVFEPNDSTTWTKLRQMIENFLLLQWRSGALQGAKPEHAYFVHCGTGSTMTQQDIMEGRLIIEIGMAIIRPAEFIILRVVLQMQAAQ